ncbi:MAG: hypothetical protein KBA75_01670 [Alphaproteobacteria bacterium]|nr:hypothetical protein [Alphaproteobacteria bacterium]
MVLLSSKDTYVSKWVAPAIIAFGFGASITYSLILSFICPYQSLCSNPFYIPLPLKLLILPVLGGVLYQCWTLNRNLADEVWDCGEALLIKSRGKEQKVALEDIAKCSLHTSGRGSVTLSLHQPCLFGTRIDFIPLPGANAIAPGYGGKGEPGAETLAQRIAQARRQS